MCAKRVVCCNPLDLLLTFSFGQVFVNCQKGDNYMNSILYHQMKSVIQAKDVYLGEDAYPYADDSLLIVSDGLGGRGGYHHKRFFHDILEEDKIYDILFAPVFEKEVSTKRKRNRSEFSRSAIGGKCVMDKTLIIYYY